jgi:hypothetical protein
MINHKFATSLTKPPILVNCLENSLGNIVDFFLEWVGFFEFLLPFNKPMSMLRELETTTFGKFCLVICSIFGKFATLWSGPSSIPWHTNRLMVGGPLILICQGDHLGGMA